MAVRRNKVATGFKNLKFIELNKEFYYEINQSIGSQYYYYADNVLGYYRFGFFSLLFVAAGG
jgi:hypothetical protein